MGEDSSSATETPPVSESPTLVNIRRRDDVWPPKYSSVRYLPKTGFTPTVVGESGQGKKFVWPPPKENQDSSTSVGRLQQGGKVQDAWNPEANALGNRPPPFAPRTAPSRRCHDDVWPPKDSEYQPPHKSSPKPVTTVGRFEDYIKCRSGPSVPPTYRTPPGTQHIQVQQLEGEFIHVSKTTTETTRQSESRVVTSTTTVAPPVAVPRRVVEEEVEYEEEEEEEEEEESEEE